jgi:ATP-dependent protease ClpP protease subunit
MALAHCLKSFGCLCLAIFIACANPVMAQAPPSHKGTIRFLAVVNPQTVNALLNEVDQLRRSGVDNITILISSPGGEVVSGISAYNYLKSLPIKLTTYNFGEVDSIAVALYCAGQYRFSVPNGAFLVHGIAANFPQTPLDLEVVEEEVHSMESQTNTLAGVISACTGQNRDVVASAIKRKTVLSAQAAKEWGLVQKIAPLPSDIGSVNSIAAGGTTVPSSVVASTTLPTWNPTSITEAFSSIDLSDKP